MINLIPKPLKLKKLDGYAVISGSCKIYADAALLNGGALETAMGTKAEAASAQEAQVAFEIDASLEREEYRLICNGDGLRVYASDFAGAFYALQTLKQIVFFADRAEGGVRIPHIEISDKPRFSHRGLLLDESRHFFGVDNVKRILDLMAMYKLNVLHWHLTDDQGWRVEIKKYPLLTEIGSKRKDSSIGGWRRAVLEGKSHEGFYTQEQIKEIVAYAKDRNINIIPEIDMPAHFAAAMAAYNYLGCREIPCQVHWFFGGAVPAKIGWRDWNRSACVGKESTYEFIFGVIDEIAELFPAPYFHIGGDEAPKGEWKSCPHCQKKMKDEGIKDVDGLQGYFNNRIAEYLKQKGKQLIVWNEALSADNIDKNVIGQYWTPKNDNNVNRHIAKGGKVVISKHQAFYFDMGYNQYPLKNTYYFEPLEKMIDRKYEDSILGLEGAMWTEWIADMEKLEMQLFPRMQALSEIAWVPEGRKDFREFLDRMHRDNAILDSMKVNYAVDKISMPKNPIKRQFEIKAWYAADQHREVRQNRKEKGKI